MTHTLILIDLDGFKLINNTYGHGAGDHLLQTVAELLRHHVRTIDLPARGGGDEFALLLVGCPPPEAEEKIERIRQRIQQIQLPGLNQPGPLVSASIGMGELSLDQGLAQRYQQADAALYMAKQSGKNQIHIAPSPEFSSP